MSKGRLVGLAGGSTAIAALAVIAIGGPAAAEITSKRDVAVIKMEKQGKELFFEAPATVEQGANLKIKNKTDPAKVGPHTFSLVRAATLPSSRQQIKSCSKKLKGICGAIVKWHDVDLQTGEVGENPVLVGKEGWDTKGSLKRKGDSWVTEREGQSFKREVTAPEGKRLQFICAVHANMQGEITVTED